MNPHCVTFKISVYLNALSSNSCTKMFFFKAMVWHSDMYYSMPFQTGFSFEYYVTATAMVIETCVHQLMFYVYNFLKFKEIFVF